MRKKQNLELKTETLAKTKLLIIEDYKQQLEELKKNKASYKYEEYRYKYILLVNVIKYNEKEYKKLIGDENEEK